MKNYQGTHNVCYWLSPASERSPLILAPLPFHQVCRLHKASFVPDLSSRVYYVIVSSEGILTERTHHPWVQPWIHRRRLAKLLVPLLQLSGVTLIFPRGGRIYDVCQTSAWRAYMYIMFESASECEGDTPSCRSCRRVQTDLWPCYQPFY